MVTQIFGFFGGQGMLTRRQKEFLAAAVDLALKNGGVHYTEVAEVLGVSRWTAYDVLNGLAQKGLLTVSHEIAREGGAGRSRVLFQPTRQALSLAGKEGDTRGEVRPWPETDQGLWARVIQAKERGVWNTLQELAGELVTIRQPLIFCAYLLVILLVALRAVDQTEEQALVGYLVPLLTGPQTALVVLAGFVLAYLVHRAPQTSDQSLFWDQLASFEEQVKMLNQEETKYLRDLTMTVVGRLWPGEAVSG